MYISRLLLGGNLAEYDHHSSRNDGWGYLIRIFIFTMLVVFSILLSSLSRAEIRVF